MQPGRKRHPLRNTLLTVAGVFVVIVVIASVASGGGKTGKAVASSSSSPAAHTSSATPAQAVYSTQQTAFFTLVGQDFPWVQTTNANLAKLGTSICSARQAGESQAALVKVARARFSPKGAARLIRLGESELCPAMVPRKPRVIVRFSGSGIENTAKFTITGSGDWLLKWHYNCAADGGTGNFIVDEDGGSDLNGANVNELGAGGSGATHAYGDTGSHYLAINSECDWSVGVVTTP